MRADTINLAIFEKYTPEELAEVAQKMAQAIGDLESVRGEKKVSDSAFTERINRLIELVSEHAKQYNKGGETAQIGCDIRYDNPEPGKKSYFRMDRGECVETHEMSWEEKQETIQFPLAQQPPQPTAEQLANPLGEEVTRICSFPHCILFADHDGDHEITIPDTPPEGDQPTA